MNIAAEESKFAILLKTVLREGIQPTDYASIRELIVHLVLRTKNLRDGFTQMGVASGSIANLIATL